MTALDRSALRELLARATKGILVQDRRDIYRNDRLFATVYCEGSFPFEDGEIERAYADVAAWVALRNSAESLLDRLDALEEVARHVKRHRLSEVGLIEDPALDAALRALDEASL